METKALFAAALGVAEPWYVADLQLAETQLTISVDFRRGGRFTCPTCEAAGCPAHDSAERRWRHLNFFEYRTGIVARTPRVRCARCGVHPVIVPWARPGSGFTLAFEAFALTLVAAMPVAQAARVLHEHDTRLWRLVHYHVDEARGARDDRKVTAVGMDETSSRRGHNYISLFVDLVARRLRFSTPGRDAATVHAFAADLTAHGGDPARITDACIDMSPAYTRVSRRRCRTRRSRLTSFI
jgi:transposase